eukprot:6477671-Amphidinium_carterae.1
MCPCAHVTTSWSRNLVRGFPGSVTTGSELHRSEEVWLRRPSPLDETGLTFRGRIPAQQPRPARRIDFQKCLRCACLDVSCLRNLASGIDSATLLSSCLRLLVCHPVRTWTAGSRTFTSDHCSGVVWNLFIYAGMYQQPCLH